MSIECHRVSKTYTSSAGPIVALRSIDLRVAAGEFVAVIGPSGCGKSTLLRLIADLEQPTSGSLQIAGKSPALARQTRSYGIVFQSPVLYEWRSARANVELPLEIVGQTRSARRARAEALLDLVGLRDFAEAYPYELSGGMQQRVAIARALALQPAILLMDEPFGALDELTREQVQEALLTICAASTPRPSVVFVTHSIAEAVFLADRVLVLSPRPGHIESSVTIDLPHPRAALTRSDSRYFALINAVRDRLRTQ
jgi:NitT/TauT family transport system ATP-binding protein